MTLLIDESFTPTYNILKQTLPHALLLHGATGVGLATIANSLLSPKNERIVIHPIQKTKTALPSISVDRIRELYREVKTTAAQFVIIDDADEMTDSAQNALLKLLEEPNSSTSFILTSHHPERLLPTIRSRVQLYHVPRVSSDAMAKKITQSGNISDAKKQQITFLSSGLPAELMRLVSDEQYFQIRSSQMQFVKTLLSASSYESIAILSKEKLDRGQVTSVIEDSVRLLSLSPNERGVHKIKSLLTAHEKITYGGNPRLHLVQAML